jgi:hypothetical protein
VGALWLVWAILLVLAERSRRGGMVVWTGILCFVPWVVVKEITVLAQWPLPRWASHGAFYAPALCASVLLVGWRRSFVPWLRRPQELAGTLLGVYAIFAALLLGQLLWSFWEVRGLDRVRPLHPSVASQSPQIRSSPIPQVSRISQVGTVGHSRGRVLWILLDELSYQQVYGARAAGLDLPAFDALAQQATVFTHVRPGGIFTQNVVPALMTGVPVDAIRSSADGARLALHNPTTKRWQAFDPHNTIFQDALDAGFHTGIAGWYNPYCRILPEVLDHCFWISRMSAENSMYADVPVTENVTAVLREVLGRGLRFVGFRRTLGNRDNEFHIADYRDLLAAGDARLADSGSDFLLLHMPVPHPEGIYDRRRRVFVTEHASYLDNLALADRYLAHVQALLKERGEWDSSTIVIMGDHSWRTQLIWSQQASWTPEDEAASHGGRFDDRPGYIVKLPYQTQGTKIDGPFPALRTRALLQGILNGGVRSSADLAAFANETFANKGKGR